MELSFFKGFTDTLPESITLDALVALMRTDESVRDYTEKHRYYRDLGNTPSAKYYKNRMPCFGVAARFAGGKRKEHITALTGLSLVDIDHIAPDQMATVLEKVRADEHTLLAYTTLSGQGVRVLFKYEMKTHPNPPCEGGNFGITEPIPLPYREGWGGSLELTDQHVNSLYCRFCLDTGRQAKISDFYIIIESDFYPEYHPLREYLESLPAWNGIDYIDQVASMVHVTGCTQEMHNRFFKQWLVAMVAAWLEPDKTNHEILTYIGPQGIYKSTFVRHLLPTELSGYFSTKNFAGRMTKDDRLELTEMALISLEELDSLQSAELNQLKAITTDPTVNERAAFARYKERRAHIASFCGTGNNPRFLTDLTDNRRWLPFLVRDIDSPWTHPMPYAGMYSQAYTLYRTGFRYWFDADDNAELSRHNRQFEEPCMEEELIATYLRVPYGDEVGEFLTATRIIELIGGSVKRPLSAKKVALCMNRLGFEQRRTKYSRGWNVIILTGNDIKEEQRLNAHRSAAE